MKVSRLRVATGAIFYLMAGYELIEGLNNLDPMQTTTGIIGACGGTLFVGGAIIKAEQEAEKQTNKKQKIRKKNTRI